MSDQKPINENDEFELLRKDLLRIVKDISAIKTIKSKDPKFLEKLEKYQRTLPKGEDIKQVVESTSVKLSEYLDKTKKQRFTEFPSLINRYVEYLRDNSKEYKIVESTRFRVGCLEIETKPGNGTLRILFNQQELIPWTPVMKLEEIQSYVTEALTKLKSKEISIEILPDMIAKIYQKQKSHQEKERKPNAHLVPIRSLHHEMIVELFRQRIMDHKNFNTQIEGVIFPEWAFLYNLDRYRMLLTKLPENKRFFFETGSQAESERIGVTLNGLSANEDYKKFCYLRGS